MLADVSKDYRVVMLQDEALQPFQMSTPLHQTEQLDVHVSTNAVCFISDIVLPTTIICVLLIGNGVVIFVIFYLRKR